MPGYLDDFTLFLSDGKAENTVQSYRRDVKKYLEYLSGCGIEDIEATTRSTVLGYIRVLKQGGAAISSANRSLSSLRAFYAFVTDGGRKMPDPTRNIETSRTDRRAPRVLTLRETERLMGAPDLKTAKGVRDRAVLELLYASGMRVSELAALDVADVDTAEELVRLKGRCERVLPLGRTAADALASYIGEARARLHPTDTDALFVSCSGKRMSRQGYWKLLKSCKEHAGLASDITPHTLRHSFAAHMLDNGADVAAVSELLGHSDVSTTLAYSKLISRHAREVYYRTHPRS